jgi:hypothetical protein
MPRHYNPLTLMITAFNKSRCQARFRNEPWDPNFTFPEWWALWEPKWFLRGRDKTAWNMVRVDTSRPWSAANVEIRCRGDWLRDINLGNTRRLGYRKFGKKQP